MLSRMRCIRLRVRGRFSKATRHWRIGTRRTTAAAVPATATPDLPRQLALWVADLGSYRLPPKFRKPRTKRQSRAERARRKGKQYALRMRIREARKVDFRHRASVEDAGNTEAWSIQAQKKLHYQLLISSLEALRGHTVNRSPRSAEVWMWVNRKGTDHPFAFETCVAIAGEIDPEYRGADPDVLRAGLKRLLKAYGGEPPHAGVLKAGIEAAEAGDPDAIAWVLSDQTTALSFAECCDALGFIPNEARQQLVLPTTTAIQAMA